MEPTKAQRNDIFEALVGGGLNPSECELVFADPSPKTALERLITRNWGPAFVLIKHEASGSSFYYTEHSDGHFEVTNPVGDERIWVPPVVIWPELCELLVKWAGDVRTWMATPDLWEESRRAAEALNSAEDADSSNAPFTQAEQLQISARIQEIKDNLKDNVALDADRLARVEQTLDRIEEASERVGRKDWLMMFNGAVFSLMLSDLIPQQAATHVVVMVITGLGHLFGIGSMPPSLPPG